MQIFKKRQVQSYSETDLLEDSLNEKPRSSIFKSLFNRWTGIYFFLIFLSMKSCGLSDTVNQAVSTYTTAPVLVQVGPDAQPILAKQSVDGVLNEENALAVASLAMNLNTFEPTLPKEAGGKIDQGMKIPGMKDLVPTPIALIYLNIVKDSDSPASLAWLEQHMKSAPKDMREGGKSTLKDVKFSPQKRKGNTVAVIVRATRVEENPQGKPISFTPYARKYVFEATDRPKFFLGSPTPLQEKYNLFAARGLKLRLPLEDVN